MITAETFREIQSVSAFKTPLPPHVNRKVKFLTVAIRIFSYSDLYFNLKAINQTFNKSAQDESFHRSQRIVKAI